MMFEWSMHGDCISIYGIYIAPLQGALLRGAPSPGPGKNKSFKELVKRAGQIPWKRVDFRWETVPSRGIHNREGPMLGNGCASMMHHKITSGGRAKRLSASAGRSQDKKFQQVSRRNPKDTTPHNVGEPIVNVLPDTEPVERISHEFTDMSKLGNAANHPSSRPKNYSTFILIDISE